VTGVSYACLKRAKNDFTAVIIYRCEPAAVPRFAAVGTDGQIRFGAARPAYAGFEDSTFDVLENQDDLLGRAIKFADRNSDGDPVVVEGGYLNIVLGPLFASFENFRSTRDSARRVTATFTDSVFAFVCPTADSRREVRNLALGLFEVDVAGAWSGARGGTQQGQQRKADDEGLDPSPHESIISWRHLPDKTPGD
jgi:hypothetical protein